MFSIFTFEIISELLTHQNRINKLVSCALVLFVLMGCVSEHIQKTEVSQKPINYNSPSTQNIALRNDSNDDKLKLQKLRKELQSSTNATEIETLKIQIAELEKRISAFENQATQSPERPTSSSSNSSAAPIQIGPKGGCYRISKNGKKYYVKC